MIEQVIMEVILEWANEIKRRVEAKWNNMSQIPGNASLHVVDTPPIAGAIMVTLLTGDFKAWIAEFGSGSLLDPSNPYLEAYKNSSMWNSKRTMGDTGFRGRKTGETVYVPDGSTYKSSGKMYGMHLEWGIKMNEHRHSALPPFKPFAPQHTIREELYSATPEIIEDIQKAVGQEIAKQLTVDLKVYI